METNNIFFLRKVICAFLYLSSNLYEIDICHITAILLSWILYIIQDRISINAQYFNLTWNLTWHLFLNNKKIILLLSFDVIPQAAPKILFYSKLPPSHLQVMIQRRKTPINHINMFIYWRLSCLTNICLVLPQVWGASEKITHTKWSVSPRLPPNTPKCHLWPYWGLLPLFQYLMIPRLVQLIQSALLLH